MKAVDRRVKYSKMVIKESFVGLLAQKEITQITIKEICEKADVNRATFYAHYTDQLDLLRKIEDEFLDEIKVYIDKLDIKVNAHNAIQVIEKIFDYLKDNASVCMLLLSEKGDINFQKKITSLVYGQIISELALSKKLTMKDAEYISAFTITGCVGIIQKWFEDDMSISPLEMSKLVLSITMGLIEAQK